jgi:hypothetical protein
MINTTQTSGGPWWLSTNFALTVVLVIGGFFVGFDRVDAQTGVTALAGAVAAFGALREKIKGVDFKGWLGNTNTWAYLGTIVVTFVPTLPVELFQQLGDIASAAIGGNWQGILVGVFALGTTLYQIFKPKPVAPVA